MYLGITLVDLGLGLAVNNLWIVLFAVPALVIVYVIAVRPEERYLSDKFGASYKEYLAQVRDISERMTAVASAGVCLFNAIELVDVEPAATQVGLCSACGVSGCSPGEDGTFRRLDEDVIWLPAWDKMGEDGAMNEDRPHVRPVRQRDCPGPTGRAEEPLMLAVSRSRADI